MRLSPAPPRSAVTGGGDETEGDEPQPQQEVPVLGSAGQYPEVDFIVPHLGGFSDDWMTFRAVIDQLVRLPNVFADTSGVRYFDALAEAARRAHPGS